MPSKWQSKKTKEIVTLYASAKMINVGMKPEKVLVVIYPKFGEVLVYKPVDFKKKFTKIGEADGYSPN